MEQKVNNSFDLEWERSVPIMDLKPDELKKIFAVYDSKINVIDFYAIQLGCRNSNYVVSTNRGKYLLRIAIDEHNNEKIAYELVKNKISVPDLLYCTSTDNANVFIYQYINAISLQKRIINSNRSENFLIEQVAKGAAIIHKKKQKDLRSLKHHLLKSGMGTF